MTLNLTRRLSWPVMAMGCFFFVIIFLVIREMTQLARAVDAGTLDTDDILALMGNYKKQSLAAYSPLTNRKEDVVPNIVHYVWFGDDEPLRFHHWLSIKSVHMFVKPQVILFHCNSKPVGVLWRNITKIVNNLRVVHYVPPKTVLGRQLTKPEHQVTVASLQLLLTQGGIYMEPDVVVVKGVKPLRRYTCTMGVEYHAKQGKTGRLNNGVIFAAPGAKFITAWFSTFANISRSEQDEHSAQIPYILARNMPQDIHIEENSLHYPSGKRLDLLYQKRYNWSKNYMIHLWSELHDIQHNADDIRTMNTTYGQVARLICYGNTKLLPNNLNYT